VTAELEDPDDEPQLLAHAKWLTQQGDPRGELIVVQHALASSPEDTSLRELEARLLADKRVAPFAQSTGRSIVWNNGFVDAAHLGETSGLVRLLPHPAARFLRTLWLRGDARLVKLLDDGPPLPHLHTLVLQIHGDVTLDLRKYRRLAVLELEAHVARLARIPDLERLYIRTQASSPIAAQAIARMPAQRLVELELGFDDRIDADTAGQLCARVDVTALRIIRLPNCDGTFLHTLLEAPFAHQLETLDLTSTWVNSTIASMLVERRGRLPALQQLYIDPNDVANEPALAAAYGHRLRAEHVVRPFTHWTGQRATTRSSP
jgi:uncharacterized protein (TIGR02996 family)